MSENPHVVVIIFLGPPGSGKGTQIKKLSTEFHLPQISTGDLFRKNIGEQTSIGIKAKQFMSKGLLVPDEVVLHMLFERIAAADCKQGYFLDGVPRTIVQADQLAARKKPSEQYLVLFLDVADEEIIKRAEGRLVCRTCSAIYHKDRSPPKHPNHCDLCGGEVYRRPDDAPEVVKKRLQVYREQTEPLVEYYKKQGILALFNADLPPDEVHKELKQYIKKSCSFLE